MKKFDFAVQSITFITAIGLLAVSAIQNDMIGFLSLVQLFLGGWQLLSYLVSLFTIAHADYQVKSKYLNYTMAVVAYFLIFYLNSFFDFDRDIKMLYLFGPPWIIALYYYHACYLKLQIQKSGQSFPGIN